ncbi:hypothetical protein AT6N2_C3013 [Agrobacterium tumefaciens]|nr:hypothetical protein AT6N2_C3013 [Agrobacterium tumefaciens]
MIDEPEYVRGEIVLALLVVEFDRPVDPENRLHAVRIVRIERMVGARQLVDEIAGTGDPAIFVIGEGAFKRQRRDDAAMAMRADAAAALDPENIGDRIGPHVETEVLDGSAVAEGNPGVPVVVTRNMGSFARIFQDRLMVGLFRKLDDMGRLVHGNLLPIFRGSASWSQSVFRACQGSTG